MAMQDQLDAERAEIDRIDLREGHQVADTEADRSAMATRRWADAAPHNGGRYERAPAPPGRDRRRWHRHG